MDGPRDYHTKQSMSEQKDKYIWYHLYVESKIWHKQTYLWNRNKLTNKENRPVVAKEEGFGGGMDWDLMISTWSYHIQNKQQGSIV